MKTLIYLPSEFKTSWHFCKLCTISPYLKWWYLSNNCAMVVHSSCILITTIKAGTMISVPVLTYIWPLWPKIIRFFLSNILIFNWRYNQYFSSFWLRHGSRWKWRADDRDSKADVRSERPWVQSRYVGQGLVFSTWCKYEPMRCRHSKSALNLSFPYHCLQSSSIRCTTLRSMTFLLDRQSSGLKYRFHEFTILQIFKATTVILFAVTLCVLEMFLFLPLVETYCKNYWRLLQRKMLTIFISCSISTHKPPFLSPVSEVTLSIHMRVMNLKCSWNIALLPPTDNFYWQRAILQHLLQQKCHSREFIAAIFCYTFNWHQLWRLRNDRIGGFGRWFLGNFCRNIRLTPWSSI